MIKFQAKMPGKETDNSVLITFSAFWLHSEDLLSQGSVDYYATLNTQSQTDSNNIEDILRDNIRANAEMRRRLDQIKSLRSKIQQGMEIVFKAYTAADITPPTTTEFLKLIKRVPDEAIPKLTKLDNPGPDPRAALRSDEEAMERLNPEPKRISRVSSIKNQIFNISPEAIEMYADRPLTDLQLSVRLSNILKRAGFQTIGEVFKYYPNEKLSQYRLVDIRGIRNVYFKELITELEKLGIVSEEKSTSPFGFL